jgi:hypothetical protein
MFKSLKIHEKLLNELYHMIIVVKGNNGYQGRNDKKNMKLNAQNR